MSTRETLIRDNVELLRQGLDLLEGMEDESYSAPQPTVGMSGVGSHVRHVIDFYDRFFDGVSSGRLDYDERRRDERVETDVGFARSRLERVIARLDGLEARDENAGLAVKQDAGDASDETQPWTRSSLERELAFVLSHTVHHYALIAVVLRLGGLEPGAEFGVAPSTLRYWKEQRACAP